MGVFQTVGLETRQIGAGRRDCIVQVGEADESGRTCRKSRCDLRHPDDNAWTSETGSTAPGQGLVKIPDWVTQNTPRP
jgi:hypothetical protein